VKVIEITLFEKVLYDTLLLLGIKLNRVF